MDQDSCKTMSFIIHRKGKKRGEEDEWKCNSPSIYNLKYTPFISRRNLLGLGVTKQCEHADQFLWFIRDFTRNILWDMLLILDPLPTVGYKFGQTVRA